MPPGGSQKGTAGKKGAGALARQRSRNTTPSSVPPSAALPPVETTTTEYIELSFELLRNITYEDIVDQTASSSHIPDSKSLDGIANRLRRLQEIVDKRGTYCDRGMRLLAGSRRARMDEIAAERSREEDRLRRAAAEDQERQRKASKANKKKRKAPPDTLAAPHDGSIERSSPLRDHGKPKKPSRDNDSASSSLSPVAPATPGAMDVDDKAKKAAKNDNDSDSDSSSDDGAPPPRRAPQANTFGDDPSTFPDPTVYNIREVRPGMSEEEIKEIYSVATYPHNDLSDMIAGDPPDRDFSNSKPNNQIAFNTFSTYIESYFRSFTEEDVAFLRERGDRVTPFTLPARAKRHYKEAWAEEDGAMAVDSTQGNDNLPPNQPRGSIENLNDELAETPKLSVGPMLSRVLQAMLPESRPDPSEDARPLANGVNGDASANGGMDLSMNGIDTFDAAASPSAPSAQPSGSQQQPGANPAENALPPATFMPESQSEAWKKSTHPKLDHLQVEERIKQELRHIGFLPFPTDADAGGNGEQQPLPPESRADYDGHFDDEVAQRLRLLQSRLREQMLVNGARKARLAALVRERMAFQEYNTILEDLDSQVQAAYLKRTRTMGKTKKKNRSGASASAAGPPAGLARPGIGDLTKTLMERRRRWIENIGTVFDDENLGKVPRASEPGSSIFRPEQMDQLMRKEKEAWDEEVDEAE